METSYLAKLKAAKKREERDANMEKLIERSESLVAEKGPLTKGELRKILEGEGLTVEDETEMFVLVVKLRVQRHIQIGDDEKERRTSMGLDAFS